MDQTRLNVRFERQSPGQFGTTSNSGPLRAQFLALQPFSQLVYHNGPVPIWLPYPSPLKQLLRAADRYAYVLVMEALLVIYSTWVAS